MEELQVLPQVTLPRAYVSAEVDQSSVTREIHVFTDASEQAYGSVAYLRMENSQGQTSVFSPDQIQSSTEATPLHAHTRAVWISHWSSW